MPTDQNAVQTARFFTNARRIPIRLGKLPNGGRIWGGPYSLVQVAVGSVVLLIGWWTTPIWGPAVGPPLIQILTLAICAAGALWGSGKIPSTRRRLPDLLLDTFSAVTVPGAGRYQGRPVKLRPPRYYGGSVFIMTDSLALTQPARSSVELHTLPITPDERAPIAPGVSELQLAPLELPANVIPIRPSTRYVTGVDRLLEQARRKETN